MRARCGLALGTIWALFACGTPTEGASGPAGGTPVNTDVSGSAQKGPFSNGSQITISELDANLVQTGRTFSATMNDDGGAYSVRGVQLGTPYARVEVNGFYFDEVRGQLSASPLSIFSYVDLSDSSTTNINLLGHLEAARLEHLVSEQAVSFGEAKAQAHREVLSLFQLEPDAIESAESLDISREGDGNAALFAISIMLQGTRTVAELSELLSNIQSDLSRDGTLDDPDNGSALMAGATTVDLAQARQNLIDRYESSGVDAAVPEIADRIDRFRNDAPYEYTGGGIVYPIGREGPNLLDPGMTRFDYTPVMDRMGFSVELPDATEVMIRITNHTTGGDLGRADSIWYYSGNSSTQEWTVTPYDFQRGVQEFSASRAGLVALQGFGFMGAGSATVEYFEYGSESPTRVKEISWGGWQGAGSMPRGEGGAAGAPSTGGRGGDGSGGASGYGGEGGREEEVPYPPSPEELCRNGILDPGEECDGDDLRGETCESRMPGWGGELYCNDHCGIDMSGCQMLCGNGQIDAGEACDPALPPLECAICTPECDIEPRPCP
jgi:hypothetical protein